MKLWWINHHARSPLVPGGTRHYCLVKELKQYGIETLIINGSFDHLGPMLPPDHESEKTFPQYMTIQDVNFLTFKTHHYKGNASFNRLLNMFTFYAQCLSELGSLRYGKPDLVIGSTVHPLAALAGLKLSKKFGVPFIYEVRDLWPLTLVELGKISKFHPLVVFFAYIDKILAKSAKVIITSAPLMKEYYKSKLGIKDEKFLWITNGTDLTSYDSRKKEITRSKSSNEIHIYYTGTLGYANALNKLLDVVSDIQKEFPNIIFHLVGNGPQKQRLQDRITNEKLSVIIQDPVPKKDVPALLSKADAFFVNLIPSPIYQYGISLNKLADYHAAGKPILMVGDAARNPVKESGGGIIFNDFQEFHNGLKDFIKLSEKEKQVMGSNAQEFAKKNYSWTALAQKLSKALLSL